MQYKVEINVSQLIAAVSQVASYATLPAVHEAIGAAASRVLNRWRATVLKAGGKGGLSQWERDAYAQSISWFYESDFDAVVRATYPHAAEIENGRPARDLKAMLGTSAKVRWSAKGKKYLIIPFRHNTPGNTALASAMPDEVYGVAKHLSASRVTGTGVRPSGLLPSKMVPAKTYKWGDRLPPGMAPKLKPEHATDPYAGMVRMDTSVGKSKSSAYLTFRVMHEQSTGWVIPARPGLMIVQGLLAEAPGMVEQAVRESLANTTA